MTKLSQKIIVIALLIIMLLNTCANTIYAAIEIETSKFFLEKIGEADYHLKYYREDGNEYRYLKCSIVGYYDKDGNFNPSYCMNKNLTGAEDTPYNVTVNSLLDNNKVWRVIKNGYPYKNAKELGVENDYNAYAVTKWAVYCVLGESELDCYKAESDDKEAVAMLKALKKLVNIGLEGTEKQDDNPLKITNVTGFIEDGEYYSQEYKVTSTAEFNTYKISNTNGLSKGSFIANTKGEKQTTFKSDENFKIMIDKNSLNKDIDVEVEISAECKSYVILEGKTTVTNTQNYVVTAGEFAKFTQEIHLEKETNTAKIQINKTDSETSKPIQGVEFELKDKDGKTILKATTDENGIANFTGLYQGSYTLVETKSNQNYIITQSEFDVDVKYNETTIKNIENNHKKGNLKIYKVDEDNNQIGLGNIEFELYSEELQKVIGTYTTNADGEIYIENLRTGNYKLKEKTTNKWYNLINDLQIQLKWKEETPITEITVKNELKKGQAKVIKIDKDNNEIKLEGVKFNVMNEKGDVLEEIVTDKNGEAVTSKYAVRDYKTLYIQEKETKKGYRLNDEIITVELKSNEVTSIKLENEVKKGRIKIVKVDKENNEIKLQDVEFKVYDEENNLVETLMTNKQGEAETKELPITSKYIIKETKTDKEYNLSDDTIEVQLKDGESTELKIENEKKKGQIKVIKVDKDNNEIKLEGVEFEVLNSQGEVLDKIKTNKEGIAKTKKLPINEEYIIREAKTLDNYMLNEKDVKIKIKDEGVEEIKIENQKIKGKIKILKTSEDDNPVTGEKAGTPLEGVKFEIFDINNNKIEGVTTNKKGIAQTSELEKGLYYIKEVSTREEYILNEKIFNIEITKHGQIVDLSIENESKKPSIDIEKTGLDEAEVGSEIEYDISVRNTGNTKLDNFIWTDIIPVDYIKVTKFETGTYNQNLRYNLYYKTNLSDDQYILLMEDLCTLYNYEIDFEKELADNEYVTEIKLDFEAVDVGFASNENPHIYAKIKEDVKSNSIFENLAKVSGDLNGYKVTDDSRWKTKTFKLLPKTGF